MRLFLGGSSGLVLYEDEEITPLRNEPVLCAVRPSSGKVVAGTESGMVLVAENGDARVVAKDIGDGVYGLACAANGTLFAGTIPAGTWKGKDMGETWTELPNFATADGNENWSAPWGTPVASAVATHPKDAKTIYCGVEVGGLYRTRDGGKKWFDLEIPGNDVHSIQVSCAKPERVYVTTGQGAFCSDDEGFTWRSLAPIKNCDYTMGLSAHPTEADRVVVSAAKGPPPTWSGDKGAQCEVHLSTDAGRRFRRVAHGLKGAVQRKALVVNPKVPSEVAFGTSAGDLYYSNDGGESFDLMTSGLGDLKTVIFT